MLNFIFLSISYQENPRAQRHADNFIDDDPMFSNTHHAAFNGCIQDRNTVDILFIPVILILWAVMTLVGALAIKAGNPVRLNAPVNDQGTSACCYCIVSTNLFYLFVVIYISYQGHVCGHSTSVMSTPYLYSVVPSNGVGVCVSSCPTASASMTSTSPSDYICLSSVMSSINPTTAFPTWTPTIAIVKSIAPIFVPSFSPSLQPTPSSLRLSSPPLSSAISTAVTPDATQSSLSSYIASFCLVNGVYSVSSKCGCVPSLASAAAYNRCVFTSSSVAAEFPSQSVITDTFQNFISEMNLTAGVIFGFGVAGALVASYIWLVVVRIQILASLLIAFSIVFVQVLFGVMCSLCFRTANYWSSGYGRSGLSSSAVHSASDLIGTQAIGVGYLIASVVWAFGTLFMIRSIDISIKSMILASDSLNATPRIFVAPLIQFVGFSIFMVSGSALVMLVISVGEN